MANPPVAAWLYGHTHVSRQATVNGVEVLSNQVGYAGKDTASGYDPTLVWKFPPLV
jgi:hypothetical protein